ncbi:MAG: FAD-binding protein, partial [Spirochaetota bacterium]
MLRLRECAEKINITGELRLDEPLAEHTTFRVGGEADLFARPRSTADVAKLMRFAEQERLPWFVLGGGSNVLVSDRGIRGLVIETDFLARRSLDGPHLTVGAGLPISEVSAYAAEHGLAGLDFIYAMPGSVGGAVWMNARCYDGEISEVLAGVELVNPDGS